MTTETEHSGTTIPTRLLKRSVTIAGHRTSLSLEDAFWQALRRLASDEGVSVAGLVARIDATRGGASLSSATRVHLLIETSRRSPR